MQEFDDLKVAVAAAVAKAQAGKEAADALATEQAAHSATRDALTASNVQLEALRNEFVTLKSQIAQVVGG